MKTKSLPQLIAVVCLAAGALMILPGCAESEAVVDVEQPIPFNHATHIRYFLSGDHKTENIKLHVGEDETVEVPQALLNNQCLDCHDWHEVPHCAGCHVIYQDEALRKNQLLRACVGCHRSVWTGSQASIPTIHVCKSCHAETLRTNTEQEKILRNYIDTGRDIPWVRINTLAEHVHFSHSAHVRFAHFSCGDCHQEMKERTEPPDRVSLFPMSRCVNCHAQQKANEDCLACHK